MNYEDSGGEENINEKFCRTLLRGKREFYSDIIWKSQNLDLAMNQRQA